MKALFLSMAFIALPASALGQDGASFDNPTPIDRTRPFLYDALDVRPASGAAEIVKGLEAVGNTTGTGVSTMNLYDLSRRGNVRVRVENGKLIREPIEPKPTAPALPAPVRAEPRN